MTTLYTLNGYNRLLGLFHVVCWTPLLIYLWKNRPRENRDASGAAALYPRWLRTLFITDLASLAVDYIDVLRYLLGHRS